MVCVTTAFWLTRGRTSSACAHVAAASHVATTGRMKWRADMAVLLRKLDRPAHGLARRMDETGYQESSGRAGARRHQKHCSNKRTAGCTLLASVLTPIW